MPLRRILKCPVRLGLDWKAVDRHMKVIEEYRLVQKINVEKGRGELYALTDKGKTALELLNELNAFDDSNEKDKQ